jgi:hypothetical protein
VLLEPHVGAVYTGVVVQQRGVESVVPLSDPPARLTVTGDGLELGHRTRLRLVAADPPTRTVRLVPA